MNPTLSILIPTYNRFNDLKRLLISLHPLTLDFGNHIEIVVGNDNPLDNKRIAKFINTLNDFSGNKNIRLIESLNNIGIYRNRLSLIENSQGDYIVFCDDDDMLNIHTLSLFIMEHIHDSEEKLNTVFIYDVVEYYHNLKDGSNSIRSKYRNSVNGKIPVAISGNIFYYGIFKGNLVNYSKYLDKFDHSKNIGDDQVLYNYFKNIVKTIELEILSYFPLYLANYDKEKDHMMLTNPKENTVDNVNKFKNYVTIGCQTRGNI